MFLDNHAPRTMLILGAALSGGDAIRLAQRMAEADDRNGSAENERRVALIRKKSADGLSAAEAAELGRLQDKLEEALAPADDRRLKELQAVEEKTRMSRYIVKLLCDGEEFFLEWSSVVDAPVTYGMTWKEFEAHYCAQYGEIGRQKLSERMTRVNESGTSDLLDRRPVEEWIDFNHAGDNEKCLTLEEIVDQYIRKPRAEAADNS